MGLKGPGKSALKKRGVKEVLVQLTGAGAVAGMPGPAADGEGARTRDAMRQRDEPG